MGRQRPLSAVAGLIAVTCAVAGCGRSSGSSITSSSSAASSTAAASKGTSTSGRAWSIIALGDSVPRGTNCACRPYPELTADGLTASTGQNVTATNDSVAGSTTRNVLDALNDDQDVIDHVEKADVVEIEIGANDVAYSSTCGTSVDCYAPEVPTMAENLLAIVRRAQSLVSGHEHLLVLLDYWSVWLGGKYAADKGPAYVAAAEEMTDRVNAAIRSTASETGAAYVDLRAAFKGPSYTYDETRYLSNDGDHPNAAGHQQIAAATQVVIEDTLAQAGR